MLGLQEIHREDLFISQSRFLARFESEGEVEYQKKEFILRGGYWKGQSIPPLRSRVPEAKILILGHSDKEMGWFEIQRIFAAGGYDEVWATHHKRSFGPRVRTLPLGLPLEQSSPPFDVLGDAQQLRSVFAKVAAPEPDSAKIMGAFSLKTHSSRARLAEILTASPIGTMNDFPVTTQGRESYLRAIKESGMVACPRGQGIDTYRFWETIYMGAVPIIVNPSKSFAQCIEGLPVIIVDRWSQLTHRSWVFSQYSRVLDSKPDFSKASLAFVVKEILEKSR
jgi:hypothetical protein